MTKKAISILNINLSTLSLADILEETRKCLKEDQRLKIKDQQREVNPFIIFTPNPEIIVYAQKDKYFMQIVNSAQINIADGSGVVWAVRKLYGRKIESISGVDLMLELAKMAAKMGFRIGLIGGRVGVAVEAFECLRQSYPNLNGWAEEGPEIQIRNSKLEIRNPKYKKENKQWNNGTMEQSREELTDRAIHHITKKIIEEKTDIVFVAMGFPKQEYLIERLKEAKFQRFKESRPLVIMAVGGAFDYISGRVPRAPVWMRDKGGEWLFRLVREPWRLSRQIKGAEFFYKVLRQNP